MNTIRRHLSTELAASTQKGYTRSEAAAPKCIQLRGIPHTALHTDLRRLVRRDNLEGIVDVDIDYSRFRPTGRAYLTLTGNEVLQSNLDILRKSSIGSKPIDAQSSPLPKARKSSSKADTKGSRHEPLTGNGPKSAILGPGAYVVMWGFPGKFAPESLTVFLRGFSLWSDGSKKDVVQVELGGKRFSHFSRFVVRLSSMSEAHRLVRQIHMTFYQPEQWKQRYPIRAYIVY